MKSLGTRGTPRQPPSSREAGTRQRRTEAVVQEWKYPEEDELMGYLEREIDIASAAPSKKRQHLRVSHFKVTPSKQE